MTNDGEMKFLGRFEKFHRSLDIGLCSITGSVEMTEDLPSIEHSAQRELLEEAGVECSLEELIYLGECITSKSMDTIVHLYAVKLHEDLDYSTPEGDGTLDESRAWCEICSAEDLTDSYDPLLSIMLSRLLERLSVNV
jgi:ADP-ribose pyrophosphatase YjhB (NUDIX family)